MKTPKALIQTENRILRFFTLALILAFCYSYTQAQTSPTVYAVTTFQKVAQENQAEFEKVMKENWKPAQQLRKQNGTITNWVLYRVHFTGTNDEYNYVSVSYFDSFAKTEPNTNYPELMKAANPKADAAAIISKTRTLRTIVRQSLHSRTDFVAAKTPVPFKYIELDFMKVKPGMDSEYLKVEQEDWKPVHQYLTDSGKRTGWNLWSLLMPGGTGSPYDYATANIYSTYEQMSGAAYEEAFKKVHPGKDLQPFIDRAAKSRDLVKRELWELVESLN